VLRQKKIILKRQEDFTAVKLNFLEDSEKDLLELVSILIRIWKSILLSIFSFFFTSPPVDYLTDLKSYRL